MGQSVGRLACKAIVIRGKVRFNYVEYSKRVALRHSGHGDHGRVHLCYSIIIILMASWLPPSGALRQKVRSSSALRPIGSLVASLFIGSLLKVLKTKYVYVIGGILQGALLVTMGYSTNLMLVYVRHFCLASATSSAVR